MGKLVLVPTPVGNLQDVTLRALDTLREATTIYAEDTRVTRKLLNHFEIQKQLIPFHAHNEHKQLERTLQTIRENEITVLVSDAGTPGISDPGFLVVRACIENELEVTCLPGATAFVPALVASGFPCDRFVFEGFLPHKKGRQTKWKSFVDEDRTIVLYESPHRLVKALEEISTFLGPDRIVCVAREISKFFEEFKRGTAAEVLEHFKKTPPKGEIVLLIKGL
ncbi:MAG: 16S rRNA (cytidine(1402)-2'-O)-methyltransferase [Candidatus Fluviicola riflensis]|nr:MAG: 16S rRNA (cytidine(1402)-2'-O)-methyltransferase [Candidatus Fluviicola riflensis]OGS78067.1 MAG: 16S rRNA (cytidine(1402)-2'-O)-methyltransferase [Candidatus Fluviicola riflensis]OGS85133.1 MAG: 16S rRNA (cytidine(1402)-2'-O)-methyltransferase [Fluviicola sp. RIFCSPHIGHO2_01_FULL_43_53]OGS89404.1 MAG: 16S rRNA (cytidine(1402)-2'-O)-methyltransferase [Fluviicola sp. RIFCSPHIGHO2_12_FULL_43_24]